MEVWEKIKIFKIFNIAAIAVIILFAVFFAYNNICPLSCDDKDSCTKDFCSAITNYKCQHKIIQNCCGNNICEIGENFENCPKDCLECGSIGDCTVGIFDYQKQQCVYEFIKDCCGNRICEHNGDYKENNENCSKDCPNCDDSNSCTIDIWNYENQDCRYEITTNCCGNKICEEDEDRKSCPDDCLIGFNEYIEIWIGLKNRDNIHTYEIYGFRNCLAGDIEVTAFTSFIDDRKEFEFIEPKIYPVGSCFAEEGYVFEDKSEVNKKIGDGFKGSFILKFVYKGSIFGYNSYDRYDGKVISEQAGIKSGGEIFKIEKDDFDFIKRLNE